MAFRHYDLTLTGEVQQLSEVLAGATDQGLRCFTLQPDGTNAYPVYFGGGNETVSATSHAIRFPPGDADNNPPGPYQEGPFEEGPIKLADYFVLGTANEIIHIGVRTY